MATTSNCTVAIDYLGLNIYIVFDDSNSIMANVIFIIQDINNLVGKPNS